MVMFIVTEVSIVFNQSLLCCKFPIFNSCDDVDTLAPFSGNNCSLIKCIPSFYITHRWVGFLMRQSITKSLIDC